MGGLQLVQKGFTTAVIYRQIPSTCCLPFSQYGNSSVPSSKGEFTKAVPARFTGSTYALHPLHRTGKIPPPTWRNEATPLLEVRAGKPLTENSLSKEGTSTKTTTNFGRVRVTCGGLGKTYCAHARCSASKKGKESTCVPKTADNVENTAIQAACVSPALFMRTGVLNERRTGTR